MGLNVLANISKQETNHRTVGLAIVYLLAIIGAEVVTDFFSATGGVVFYTIILIALIVHSALMAVGEPATSRLLLAMSLTPLVRMLSRFLPFAQFEPVYWYLIIYPPLLLAAWVAMRRLNFSAREVGLNLRRLPLQLVIALSGFVFGVVEYLILKPAQPIVTELTVVSILLTVIALAAGTGFVEEFIFRGVLQKASIGALGKWGLSYVAFLFAILHLIHYSAIDIVFVFVVGLFFGWVVNKTGSLLGVTLSHSITNIMLFLVIPLYF